MSVASQAPYKVIKEHISTTCYHCGSSCEEELIRFDDKPFCCEGCRMVYDILNSNGLCKYYEIDENAGISLKGKSLAEYAYLDDPDVKTQLLQFTDGKQSHATFYIPAIHCNSCIWLLENLYKLSPGVMHSTVHFPKKELYLRIDENETSLRKIVELLASLGYPPAITLNDLDNEKKPIVNRTFYYQLGIAGFAFGNIMLLSFPEYLGLELKSDPFYAKVFGYLNIILALPVVFYSGRDYFINAWHGLRRGELIMDFPLALGIAAFFVRSTYEILSHTGAGFMDSLAGLVFFLLIGKWFQQRTYYHISFERDYKSYFPIAATLKKGNEHTTVALDKLKQGDIIVVKNQEIVPTDAVLLDGEAHLDYSFVTGEAEAIEKAKGEKVYAGGRQMGAAIELMVSKKVSQSYLTQLWNNEVFNKPQHLAASIIANRVGKYFTIAILSVGIGTLIYWLPRDGNMAFNTFTSVLIIACPCAVALAIPFIFGNVLRILGRHQFYLRNTTVIESLDTIDAVVFDKTGTLTSRQQQFTYTGEMSPEIAHTVIALANASNHPASEGILAFLKNKFPKESLSTTYKPQQWNEHIGKGLSGIINGKPVRLGSASWIGLSDQTDSSKGAVVLEVEGRTIGYFTPTGATRSGIGKVLDYFKNYGKLYLLSGDSPREKSIFEQLMPANAELHFEQSPFDKLHFIQDLQADKRHVLMIGDGLNDAGALKQSDIGIVISDSSNNFTPACDAILRAEQFALLPQMIKMARRSIYLVYGAYALALVYNIFGLTYAVQGVFTPIVAAILMPLSSITIVTYGLISSNLVARNLGLFKWDD